MLSPMKYTSRRGIKEKRNGGSSLWNSFAFWVNVTYIYFFKLGTTQYCEMSILLLSICIILYIFSLLFGNFMYKSIVYC
jgi:hypothetical protein